MTEETCHRCDHPGWKQWMWAPGHISGSICRCCALKVWRETLKSVQDAIDEALSDWDEEYECDIESRPGGA